MNQAPPRGAWFPLFAPSSSRAFLLRSISPDIRSLLIAALALLVLAVAGPARARGLALETAPWYDPTLADTSLSLGLGVTYAEGDTQAVVFPIVLTPLRRGPLCFAVTWSYVSVRTAREQVFGTGDPKVHTRLRLYGSPGLVLHLDGAARLPLASPKLFPWADGGQELELGGSLGMPRLLGLVAGAGRIWCEPPPGSALRPSDVPHATHLWAALSRCRDVFVLGARYDGLVFRGGGSRSLVEASLARLEPHGLHVELVVGFEIGPGGDRVYDRKASLRFASLLR